jgi:osmoprotectant transport system ATP-binding protein
MAIVLKDVRKTFSGASCALQSLSLTFGSARTHVLLGSSGSGKSTLLRLIAGITPPDTGEILVEDVPQTPENQPRIAEKIGYVIQDGGLFPHLTAAGNISLKSELLGKPKPKIQSRIHELSALVGIAPSLLERLPRQLSGGERQRISLMRALMLDPPILLLDEPLGALDPIVRRSLQRELRRIFDRLQKTVILVTHDVAEAQFFGETVTLMNDGRIVQRGSFQDLVSHPRVPFVSEFILAQRDLGAQGIQAA